MGFNGIIIGIKGCYHLLGAAVKVSFMGRTRVN